jgi:hypothetical protein
MFHEKGITFKQALPWRKSFREVMEFHEIFHKTFFNEKTFRQSFLKVHE